MKPINFSHPTPPVLAEEVLRAWLPAGPVGESILGDLREEYRAHPGSQVGRFFWYWGQTLTLLLGYSFASRLWPLLPAGPPLSENDNEKETTMRLTMQSIQLDCRYFFRAMRSNPVFSLIAIGTLALGIGANCAVFSVISGVLLKPLPYPEPERIVTLWEKSERGGIMHIASPNFHDWQQLANRFESLALLQSPQFGGPTTVLGGVAPVRARVLGVSTRFFDVFGVPAQRGRLPEASEFVTGSGPVIVVSHRFWTTQLESRPNLAGTQLEISGVFAEVIGVMPPGFNYPGKTDIWYPTSFSSGGSRTSHNWMGIGRLASGTSLAAASREMTAIAQRLKETHGSEINAIDVALTPLHEELVGAARRPLLLLLAGSGLVLLIACTNIAASLLARGAARQGEVAIRAALGASRGRLLQQLLTESVILALLGAVAGILLGAVGVRLLLSLGEMVPRIDDITMDLRTTLFAIGLTLLAAVMAGVFPALRLTSSLRHGVGPRRGTSTGKSQRLFWDSMVAAEVALALLLLVSAGLLMKSFWGLLAAPAGFDPEGVLTAEISVSPSRYPDLPQVANFYQRALAELESIPGVAAAGLTNHLPLGGLWYNGDFEIEGVGSSGDSADYRIASRHYFEGLGIPLLRGRLFEDRDNAATGDVVIINQAAANRFWEGADPIGKRIRNLSNDSWIYPDRWLTIIGTVGNARHRNLIQAPRPALYVHYLQRPGRLRGGSLVLKARAEADPGALAAPLRERLRTLDQDLAVTFSTMESRLLESVGDRRFSMLLLGIFAALALILAAMGIYGVVSYAVERRTREIGIRIALGATSLQVLRLALQNSMISVWIGLLLGIGLASGAAQLLRNQLYEVDPTDPMVLLSTLAMLVGVATIAAWVPAHRTTRIDPLVSLRID